MSRGGGEMERKWSTITFLLCLAGTIYFVISIERYITVAHNKYCKRFVTRKLLVIIIVCVALSSFLWATLYALFIRRVEIVKLAKLYIAIFAYTGALLAITTILSLTLLKYVKLQRPSPSIKHAHDSHLTKKIAMILAVAAVTYLPMIIFSNIATYSVVNSKDTNLIKKTVRDLRWIPTSCQLNVILNSIVYLMRNNRMRRYYYKLLRCRYEVKKCKPIVFNVIIGSAGAATPIKSKNTLSWHFASIK